MPDVATDPVTTEPVETQTTTTPVAPESSTPASEPSGDSSTHPLDPGGDRFKQVWARAKAAEEREKRLADELQREREERIRYEERARVQEVPPTKREPIYTWAQLEEMVSNGQLTRAQASEYREGVIKRELAGEQEKQLDQRLAMAERARKVQTDLDRYKTLVPSILQPGTAEREKVATEFRYMVDVLGMPSALTTELAAARAVFGDIGTLERSRLAATTARENREVTVETTTPGRTSSVKKDPVDVLTPREKEHYERMIKNGRYPGGWDEVRKELVWERKARG